MEWRDVLLVLVPAMVAFVIGEIMGEATRKETLKAREDDLVSLQQGKRELEVKLAEVRIELRWCEDFLKAVAKGDAWGKWRESNTEYERKGYEKGYAEGRAEAIRTGYYPRY